MSANHETPRAPANLEALFALAVRQHGAGRFAEAAAAYRQVLALRPDLAEVHNNLGTAMCQQGQIDEARPHFEQAIALAPNLADAHNNLGNVLRTQNQLELAALHYERVAALKPSEAEAHHTLGNVLRQLGRYEQAAACFQRALVLKPSFAEAHSSLGFALAEQNRLDEAAAHYQQALALKPGLAAAHNNLGNVFRKQGLLAEAEARYRQALAVNPNYVEAHYNLGTALWNQGQLDEAVAAFAKAIALKPDFDRAHDKLGCVLREQFKLGEARQAFERLAAIVPSSPNAELGLAICDLLEEKYESGWRRYEARLRLPGLEHRLNLPRWQGEPLAGRTLLVLAEQGLGDTLHFVRYLPMLKALGGRIVLAVQPRLGRLLAAGTDWDELFLLGAGDLPAADYYLPLMSAPYALSSAMPGQVPYLTADPDLTDRWRAELARMDGFKIGIAWQGSRDHRADRWRSIPLAQFAPLARLSGVRLISLQKGFGSEQLAQVDFPILDLASRLDETTGPFVETAAVIRNLDLVVTADSAIAHLAGALAAPVFVALHHSVDWRWLLAREDTPWYPTMRLFRQQVLGQWPDVFERIAAAVESRLSPPA